MRRYESYNNANKPAATPQTNLYDEVDLDGGNQQDDVGVYEVTTGNRASMSLYEVTPQSSSSVPLPAHFEGGNVAPPRQTSQATEVVCEGNTIAFTGNSDPAHGSAASNKNTSYIYDVATAPPPGQATAAAADTTRTQHRAGEVIYSADPTLREGVAATPRQGDHAPPLEIYSVPAKQGKVVNAVPEDDGYLAVGSTIAPEPAYAIDEVHTKNSAAERPASVHIYEAMATPAQTQADADATQQSSASYSDFANPAYSSPDKPQPGSATYSDFANPEYSSPALLGKRRATTLLVNLALSLPMCVLFIERTFALFHPTTLRTQDTSFLGQRHT